MYALFSEGNCKETYKPEMPECLPIQQFEVLWHLPQSNSLVKPHVLM